MRNLDTELRQHFNPTAELDSLPELDGRAKHIRDHYLDRMTKGMSFNRAKELAIHDIEGKNANLSPTR